MFYKFPEIKTDIVNGEYESSIETAEYFFNVPLDMPTYADIAAIRRLNNGLAMGVLYCFGQPADFAIYVIDCRGAVLFMRDGLTYHEGLLLLFSLQNELLTPNWKKSLFISWLNDFQAAANAEFFAGQEQADMASIYDVIYSKGGEV